MALATPKLRDENDSPRTLFSGNIHFQEVIPGCGQIDYKTYLRSLAQLPVDAPLMLEHPKKADEYEEGKTYIQKVAASIGVEFA